MKKQIFLLTAVILCLAASVLSQETSSMPSFSPEIKRVAVFKNGYAFTYREGEARTANGWAYTTSTPLGAFGTVWGYTTTSNTNVSGQIISMSDNGTASREGLNLQAINPNSAVKWNVTAPPGEKEVRYTYKVYVQK